MALVTGGLDVSRTVLASTDLYDPTAGTFSATGSMTTARYEHTTTLLPSGMVLIAGGHPRGFGTVISAADLYDPAAETFSATGSMTAARYEHTATLLPNGMVLIAGGSSFDIGAPPSEHAEKFALSAAELFDPSVGTFTSTGSMAVARLWHTAALLSNGRVLIAGGVDDNGGILASAELYE